jgi:hypothetical protein
MHKIDVNILKKDMQTQNLGLGEILNKCYALMKVVFWENRKTTQTTEITYQSSQREIHKG